MDELEHIANTRKVAVVVLNWNGYDDTVQCIRSLQEVSYSGLEIIIVDNGSTDGSASELSKLFPDVTIVRLPTNLGYAGGNNAGIQKALEEGADFILVLNNDVVVEREFLKPLLDVLEKENSVGVVTPKVYYFDRPDTIYSAGGTYSRFLCSGVGNNNGMVERDHNRRKDRVQDVSFAPGCALMIRREVLEKVGAFDEKFFMYFEDLEFSQRVREHFRIVFTPHSRIFHKVGAGIRWSLYTPLYLYYYTRNRLWFIRQRPVLYRLYVLLFSLVNTAAKSIVVLLTLFIPAYPGPNRTREKLVALWRGLRDGIFGVAALDEGNART